MASSIKRFIVRYGWAYVFISMPVLLFFVFKIYPIISAFIMSFQRYGVMRSTWIGTDNYVEVITDPIFWRALRVTLVYTAGTVPVNIGISFILAWLISSQHKRLHNLFKGAFYLPSVTSGVTTALVWLWIFNPTNQGLLNRFLALFGIDNIIWLGTSKTALFSLMLMTYLGSHGPAIVLYMAAMGGIPDSLYEAADIDGASKWAKMRYFTLPLLKPTSLYLLVTGIISSFQVWNNVYLMTSGGPNFATTTLAYYIYNTAFHYFDFGRASAMSFLLAIIIVVTSLVQYKYLSSNVEY